MTKVVAAKKARLDRCHRCGGFMVEEQDFMIRVREWRCVSCGERIDPVILTHRQKDFTQVEDKQLFAGKG